VSLLGQPRHIFLEFINAEKVLRTVKDWRGTGGATGSTNWDRLVMRCDPQPPVVVPTLFTSSQSFNSIQYLWKYNREYKHASRFEKGSHRYARKTHQEIAKNYIDVEETQRA
jgi:hypothetical protein